MVPDSLGSPPSVAGSARERIGTIDWSATSVGPRELWPECLRCVLEVVLAARIPMLIAWGPDQIVLYNDACSELLGGNPGALGRPARELPAAWVGLVARLSAARDGRGGASFDAVVLETPTPAGREQCRLKGSISTITDEAARARGVLCQLDAVSAAPPLDLRKTGTHRITPARLTQRPEDAGIGVDALQALGAEPGSVERVMTVAMEARVGEMERAVRFSEVFAGMLGHDLRNPLSAITTSAELLARRAESEKIGRPVARILASAARMERMIGQLLDFTRIRLGQGLPLDYEALNLAELARTIIDELEPVFERRIELGHDGSVQGSWDRERLSQLLSNLAANACQHGALDAPIVVHLDGSQPDTVLLTVSNGGVIPPELLPIIFEPFRRSVSRARAGRPDRPDRSSGLGLGLHISEQIARAFDGSIEVASSPASGTRFSVVLPRTPRPAPLAPLARRAPEQA